MVLQQVRVGSQRRHSLRVLRVLLLVLRRRMGSLLPLPLQRLWLL